MNARRHWNLARPGEPRYYGTEHGGLVVFFDANGKRIATMPTNVAELYAARGGSLGELGAIERHEWSITFVEVPLPSEDAAACLHCARRATAAPAPSSATSAPTDGAELGADAGGDVDVDDPNIPADEIVLRMIQRGQVG